MKHVVLTSDNRAAAFYDDDLHSAIPEGAVEITDELWLDWIKNTHGLAYDPVAKALVDHQPTFSVAQLTAYLTHLKDVTLAKGTRINVAPSGAAAVDVLSDGTAGTLGTLGLLALAGQINPTGTRTWVDNDGEATVLTGTEIVALASLAVAWADNVYAFYASVCSKITKGEIATPAELDALTWPTA